MHSLEKWSSRLNSFAVEIIPYLDATYKDALRCLQMFYLWNGSEPEIDSKMDTLPICIRKINPFSEKIRFFTGSTCIIFDQITFEVFDISARTTALYRTKIWFWIWLSSLHLRNNHRPKIRKMNAFIPFKGSCSPKKYCKELQKL